MNQKLTIPTRQKIKDLTLHHFRLCDGVGDNFAILMDIFSNKEPSTMSKPNQIGFEIKPNKEQSTMSKPNQIGFEIKSKTKCLKFLTEKNLIIKDNKITALGISVILSHKLGIPIFSVFILSKLYCWQTTINKEMVFPLLTLYRTFELFPSVSILCRNVYSMKQKQILDNNLRYRIVRININTLNDYKKYDKYFQQISQYVDDTSEKIENLITVDPLVTNLRDRNLKLFAGINCA